MPTFRVICIYTKIKKFFFLYKILFYLFLYRMNIKKGQNTRQTILDSARQIFNERGLNITLEKIAAEMGLTKSRITNHFATKESLFLAILRDYEESLARCAEEIGLAEALELSELAEGLSAVMDVQYQYRCGIAFVAMVTHSQHELHRHISENYKKNVRSIMQRTGKMVDLGILKPEILNASNFSIFVFQYTNILTNWVVNLELYDLEHGYSKMKPVYLNAALSCFKPFLTKKGEKQFSEIDFRQTSKSVKMQKRRSSGTQN